MREHLFASQIEPTTRLHKKHRHEMPGSNIKADEAIALACLARKRLPHSPTYRVHQQARAGSNAK
jgi:hypothetical protein